MVSPLFFLSVVCYNPARDVDMGVEIISKLSNICFCLNEEHMRCMIVYEFSRCNLLHTYYPCVSDNSVLAQWEQRFALFLKCFIYDC